MNIKTSEATAFQLDWLVATCEGTVGQKPEHCFDCKHLDVRSTNEDDDNYCTHPAGDGWNLMEGWGSAIGVHYGVHHSCPITETTAEPYSTDWSQGGPIIERERIGVRPIGDEWGAGGNWDDLSLQPFIGPTPLIAAMRCYVSSRLGDEVEVPEEMT